MLILVGGGGRLIVVDHDNYECLLVYMWSLRHSPDVLIVFSM